MHRAAASAAQARFPAENLGQGCLQIAALGEHMTVATVARKEKIITGKMGADTDCNRLLPGREMRKSRYLAGAREPLHLAFEQPYPPQCVIHLFPVIERRFGHNRSSRAM